VGNRHPLAVEILGSLCALRRAQGDTRGAEEDCRKALALALDLQGPQHRATVDARRQLAAVHVDQGRYSEAATEFTSSQAWLLARLGMEHEEVSRNYNSLAIVDWERGDTEAALHNLDRAIAISRKPGHAQLPASQPFNRGTILHHARRDTQARLQLRESLRPREAPPGDHRGLAGDSLRLTVETSAGLGEDALAVQQLRRAVSLTREGYGATHPHALRAELSLARLQARTGSAAALGRLERLASLSATDIERRRIAWLARAYLSERTCHGPQRGQVLQQLAALDLSLQQAQPEGGAVMREVDAIRAGCQRDVDDAGQ